MEEQARPSNGGFQKTAEKQCAKSAFFSTQAHKRIAREKISLSASSPAAV
jgi:hypothetical protein